MTAKDEICRDVILTVTQDYPAAAFGNQRVEMTRERSCQARGDHFRLDESIESESMREFSRIESVDLIVGKRLPASIAFLQKSDDPSRRRFSLGVVKRFK